MIVTNKFCDLCRCKEKEVKDRHWTEAFGRAIFDLKDIAGMQWKVEREICRPCGERIRKVILTEMELICSKGLK